VVACNNPDSKILEANKLLSEQQELGFNFDLREEVPIGRMLGMEDRDRGNFEKCQESTHPQ
jgi:hypothetical protein